MARLPKSLIKKYGISKKAWAVFRGHKAHTTTRKTRVRSYMARHKRHRKGSFGGSKGFGFGSALKIFAGAGVAVIYEVFVSPMIPLSATIKNIVEMVLGLFLMSMRGMPMIVRAGGAAIATINAFQLIYPLVAGMGGKSGTGMIDTSAY
jgi:hypothetical protein